MPNLIWRIEDRIGAGDWAEAARLIHLMGEGQAQQLMLTALIEGIEEEVKAKIIYSFTPCMGKTLLTLNPVMVSGYEPPTFFFTDVYNFQPRGDLIAGVEVWAEMFPYQVIFVLHENEYLPKVAISFELEQISARS